MFKLFVEVLMVASIEAPFALLEKPTELTSVAPTPKTTLLLMLLLPEGH